MTERSTDEVLRKVEDRIRNSMDQYSYISANAGRPLPNPHKLAQIVQLFKEIVFPGFFNETGASPVLQQYHISLNLECLNTLLKEQIANGLHFFTELTNGKSESDSSEIALAFIERIPEIKRLLFTDVEAMFDNDPAARSYGEVIICYPSIQAMIHYRMAHELLLLDVPVVPRVITEMAHSATGIDIHPGARIGEYFSIDHGTGVVIGETCIIGHHVHLYKGVTLGAKSYILDECGKPINVPRHPIVEDRVIVYSNATILGRITIGHDSIIGGNIWLTESVPPHSRITQRRATSSRPTTSQK
ncbi:MAG: serine acetyltransferase [Tannerella sp.]|jgi:serine O-acetyltransferase|nr:serine acetyltransferase [Tannerella sp.]